MKQRMLGLLRYQQKASAGLLRTQVLPINILLQGFDMRWCDCEKSRSGWTHEVDRQLEQLRVEVKNLYTFVGDIAKRLAPFNPAHVDFPKCICKTCVEKRNETIIRPPESTL